MGNQELIKKAASIVKSKKIGDYTVGDVGCVLISDKGNLYQGVCIDVGSSMGFCAEHNAIGSMVTEGESKIKKIVTAWKDKKGEVFVLSPCGRCREFMFQIDKDNLEAEVILGRNKTAKLSELLPYPRFLNKD